MACNKVAWMGYLLIGGNLLPYLSANVVKKKDIVSSQPISSGPNLADRSIYNYSTGKTIVEATMSFEVFGGNNSYGQAVSTLIGLALANACKGAGSSGGTASLTFSPVGGTATTVPGSGGKAVISSLSFRGNSGGIVNGSVTILSTNSTGGLATSISAASLLFEAVGTTEDNSPLPYYNSNFLITGSGESSDISNYITDWDITINNNVTPLYTLCKDNDRAPEDLRLGALEVSGSFAYWSPTGVYGTLKDGAGLNLILGISSLTSSNVVFQSDGTPINSPNAAGIRKVEYSCFGVGDSPALRSS